MPNNLDDSTALLRRLLQQMISEKDLARCDQLGSEIWRVLNHRDRIRSSVGYSEADRGPTKRTNRGSPV
jgi:hypothetical protein